MNTRQAGEMGGVMHPTQVVFTGINTDEYSCLKKFHGQGEPGRFLSMELQIGLRMQTTTTGFKGEK